MGRYVWRATANILAGNTGAPTLGRAILVGALITGGIGFAGGFFGPMIFASGANQGPMLGIFIAGPAGAVIGAGIGLVYWIVQRRPAV